MIDIKATNSLHSLLDFFRYALSKANQSPLYYGHGTDNAWDDMQALVFDGLALDYDPLFWPAILLPEEKEQLLLLLQKRIVNRLPVPYLTKRAYFAGLRFYVDERVLIPRSPIAELIEQQFSPWLPAEPQRILDLCCGSACIAIACCHAFPEALVDAVDLSEAALAVAAINQQTHGLESSLRLIQSDGFTALAGERYDLIVSNPPYVAAAEMQTLPEEYRHEPRMALEAADEGLALVEQILRQAKHHLTETGILVVEVGNSEEALVERYPEVPFTWLEFERGGQGIFLLDKASIEAHF